MHRLLVESALLDEEQPRLPAEAARHLRVVRPKAGEEIELFDGRGCSRRYACLAAVPPALRALSARQAAPRQGRGLTLFACVTKGSRWDWTLEKATELGVTRIVPVLSARTIVRLPKEERAAKRERWQRIVEDAARQSDALWLPEIAEPMEFAEALPLVRETLCFVGALTDPPSPLLLAAALERLRDGANAAPSETLPLATFIGPEGDFTPDELAALLALAIPTSFGPTILRAETAALYAVTILAAVSSSRGEMAMM